LIVKSETTSTRSDRVLLRSSHFTAFERLMLVIVTVPAARLTSVVVSVHVAPSVAPAAGSIGKKFLKPPIIGDKELPESATIESIVTVVGYPALSAGPLIVALNRTRSP
jgi:hypothetical protein